MTYFHTYVYLIIVVKLLFALLAITHIYLKAKGDIEVELDKKIVYWKERIEFIFEILMAFLLIYLFNPRYDHKLLIDQHIKILLYLFGFILLITAKWSNFFKESIYFKDMQQVTGK